MAGMRIGLVTMHLFRNRIPFFEAIAERKGIKLGIYSTEPVRKYLDEYEKQHGSLKAKYWVDRSENFLNFIMQKWDCLVITGYADYEAHLSFIYAKMRKIPIALFSESTLLERRRIRKVGWPLIRFFISLADACIVPGANGKEFHLKYGCPEERIFVVPYVVDNEVFIDQLNQLENKRALKKALGIREEKVILFVGMFIPRKGIVDLLKAYKNLRKSLDSVGLILVGSGELRSEIELFIKREGLEGVYLPGFIDGRRELAMFYSVADVFVLPSYLETWGLVLNEAMACGLPVIATDRVGSAVDLIEEGKNGIIVKAGDVKQLTNALRRILSNEELRKKMSLESRRRILEHFSIEKAVDEFVSAIQHIRR